MKQNLRFLFVAAMVFAVMSPLAAESGMNILATNSWTAAFVQMAGGSAEQLAPADMEHPPEYELKPSDVRKIRDADLLVFAGYEVLMKTVFESFSKPEEQMVKITTSYSPAILEKSVTAIAEKLGTVSEAERNIASYKAEVASAREQLQEAGLFGLPVLVHFHQKPLAQALGFEILGIFGPQPLEIRQIAEFGSMSPELIIDNAHNPMAKPISEVTAVRTVELVNFPGFPNQKNSTAPDSLIGVLRLNTAKLLD